jgi:hypothetical protein
LWLILVGKIDLTGLISEPNGEASLSRFQFLVFYLRQGEIRLRAHAISATIFHSTPGTILTRTA